MCGYIQGNKSNIYEKDWPKFDRHKFILDYFSVDCENLVKIDEINMLLDTYVHPKRINKYKIKIKSKPGITFSLQKSISVKNKLLTLIAKK